MIFALILSAILTYVSHRLIQKNRYRLLCGMVANLTLIVYFVTLSLAMIAINQPVLESAYLILLALIAIPIILLIVASAYLFIFNGLIVWRRESHSLGNVLTLVIGILLIAVPAGFRLLNSCWPNSKPIAFLQNISILFVLYLVFWVLTFLTSFVITKVFRPKSDQEYAIVLGSGLIGGTKVSPLLGSRIQAAIDLQKNQFNQTGRMLTIVMSSGQGGDEKLAEGVAMKAYALEQGVPEDKILVDDQSKNTYENMLFSKQLLDEHGFDLKKGIFATNDYHVFRAAGYARLVGLDINGIGAKTSSYFLPNALIREYIAILLNHKRFHLIMAGLMVLLSALIFI
ncbi:YdcF family protein [Fructobacillus parabroussonetiae]|uniref:YdcF family protein n=1 Tax=Fructobacillus parabroussonetiae TaxID=2713174 RepID=A0ABS5QVP9_9LACO|nr:YdcF family protein [Fructobacillus parabroussonetiae]MBS9337283.1 YdcF family protein [Fructobacillus parabroussonetiae]